MTGGHQDVFKDAQFSWGDIEWQLTHREPIVTDPIIRNHIRAELFREYFQQGELPRQFNVMNVASKLQGSSITYEALMKLAADCMGVKQTGYKQDFPSYSLFKPLGTVPWEECMRRKSVKRSSSRASLRGRSNNSKRSLSRSVTKETQAVETEDDPLHLLKPGAVSETQPVKKHSKLGEEVGDEYLRPEIVIEAIWVFEQYQIHDSNGNKKINDQLKDWEVHTEVPPMLQLARKAWSTTRKLFIEAMDELFELIRPVSAADFTEDDSVPTVTVSAFKLSLWLHHFRVSFR